MIERVIISKRKLDLLVKVATSLHTDKAAAEKALDDLLGLTADEHRVEKVSEELTEAEFQLDVVAYRKASMLERVALEHKWGARSSYFREA